ncbi:Nuclear protein localization protein 4 like protein [Nosema granulosis]|uniref:Nuclear protein localization protein 4 n=1 Tax=Nosema granulosis TaxID=83296 RepID=A0A9P6GZ17_9MICR|nr:Nuclear protein localization protein 4 like protein [Nosema granulosis]
MIIFIRGPSEQKRVEIREDEDIYKKVQDLFKVEQFAVFKDSAKKCKIHKGELVKNLGLKNGSAIYVEYEIVQKEVKRVKDKMMCSHDVNAMCANCAPLDPWDEKYYKEKNIKYLSFGSYKEMLKHQKTNLEMENYDQKKCAEHSSKTKCVRCQDADILLIPQIYRMVDHIEFDNQKIVENFIKNWKDSHKQFFGLLIGKYKQYDRSPLGTRAVVSGIWEPEQENFPDGFVLTETLDDDFLDGTGLEIVGMIYTDIIYDGKLTSDRLMHNYLVSSLEVCFMAKMQFMFPHIDNNKVFNSRFVTIIATPNESGDIELLEYQVSSQCMALTRNNYILPTENPEKSLAKKNIFYKTRDEANNLLQVKADPYLPNDYFLVRLTHGMKSNPLFTQCSFIPFKLGNSKMSEYFGGDYSLEKFSNFNLLMKLKTRISNFNVFLKAIISKDTAYFEEFKRSEEFQEIVLPLQKYNKIEWVCEVCTYINSHRPDNCEICESPRNFN